MVSRRVQIQVRLLGPLHMLRWAGDRGVAGQVPADAPGRSRGSLVRAARFRL